MSHSQQFEIFEKSTKQIGADRNELISILSQTIRFNCSLGSTATIIFQTAIKILQRIGNTFKTRRQALNLSQIDLADRAQVHRTYIGNIEHGTRNITVSVLVRLARALDIPFIEIAGLVDHLYTNSKTNKAANSETN